MKAIPIAFVALVAACGTVENVSAQQPGPPSNIYIADFPITQEAQPSPSDAQAQQAQAQQAPEPGHAAGSHAAGAQAWEAPGGQADGTLGQPCSPCDPCRSPAHSCCGTPSCRPQGGGLFGRCRWGRRR